ncbi:MAG: aminopeptidase P family protein [Trueperaceae bacterium]|nr:aminopeptidase P family protein [Trueperaceae bacterium]
MSTPRHFIRPSTTLGRHAALRAWLAANGFDAYLVSNPENTAYLSGWKPDVESWERPFLTVIPRQGEPFMVLHELSIPGVGMAADRGTLVIEDRTFYVERPSTDPGVWTRASWAGLVAGKLRSRGLEAGKLALDSSLAALDEVQTTLPNLQIVSAASVLTDLRAVKSDEELELMHLACQLTDFGQQVFRELTKPGELIAAVDAETVLRMRVEGARRFPGADLTARAFSLTGPDSAAPHGTGAGSDARIERGHGIVNIIVASLGGYCVENERTLFVGEASEEQRRAYACIREAQAAAVASCVPGAPLAGIDRAALAVIARHGYSDRVLHRAGHGIGLRGHDQPADMAFNERPLLAGEVYTIEPGIYLPGLGGFRIDDTVVVGEPPRSLTSTPRDIGDVIIPA